MIIDINALKYKGQIVGVRIKTDTASFYDIDIDIYTKKLGLNPNVLKQVNLIEDGNLLVTADEIASGILVQDASNNEDVLEEIKISAVTSGGFLNKKNLSPDKLQAKLKKMRQDLNDKYWRYFTYNKPWLDEFIDYHIANFEGNNNIYTNLSPTQLNAVKAFFRWRSKLLFIERSGDKILHVKPNKTADLIALMGNATDWQYDGMVDTGYKGASSCALGHPLRYEHYAYSPTLNKYIIFGSTCVSDFFNVDESVIRALNKAQDELLSDLKVIVFIMRTGKYTEYIDLNYKNLPEVFKFYKGNFKGLGKNTDEWVKHISNFVALNLPLTHSMIFAFSKLTDTYTTDVSADTALSRLTKAKEKCKELGYPDSVIATILGDEQETALCRNLKIYIGNDYTTDAFVKRGIRVIPVLQKAITKLATLTNNIRGLGGYVTREYYFVTPESGRRLATKNEIRFKVATLVEETYLREDRTKKLLLLLNYASKYTTTVTWSYNEFRNAKAFADVFMSDFNTLVEALDWASTSNFIDEIKPATTYLQYPSFVPDELINSDSLDFRYEFIVKNKNTLSRTDIVKFAKVHAYALQDSKTLIDEIYNKLNNTMDTGDKRKEFVVNSVEPVGEEDKKILETLDKAIEDGIISKDEFVCKILVTVKSNGKISVKQRKYIMEAYNKVTENKAF